jgi:hypothetical protein
MLALFVTAVTDKRPLDQVQSSGSAAISLIILYNPFRMTRSLDGRSPANAESCSTTVGRNE